MGITMKKFIVLIATCLFLNSCVSNITSMQPEATIRYDRFSGYTSKLMLLHRMYGYKWSLEIKAWSTYTGSDENQRLRLRFISSSEHWKYLRYRNLYFLIDGESESLGEPDHDGSVFSRSVLEQMTVPVDRSFLEKLANSSYAEFKIGIYEGVFPDSAKMRLKTFLGINNNNENNKSHVSSVLEDTSNSKEIQVEPNAEQDQSVVTCKVGNSPPFKTTKYKCLKIQGEIIK
jgi:hypothetical protein